MKGKIFVLAAIVCLFCAPFATADVVTDWNTVALDAIRVSNTPPPAASRNLAILHISVYDAVNGIRRTHKPYFVSQSAPPNTSIEAAASAAARLVLATLYPNLQSRFQAHYEDHLNRIRNGAGKTQGIAWGESVAAQILQLRNNDGSSRVIPFTPGTQPGQWRPTVSFGGQVLPPLAPQWATLAPFALVVPTQFRPPAPPALTSAQYAADVNQVKAFGKVNSVARTPEQTEIALFWSYGPGTATPPGH